MNLSGEPDTTEVHRDVSESEKEWKNVTMLFVQQEVNFINAIEKAMQFHNTLKILLEFVVIAEKKIKNLSTPLLDDTVKDQIDHLKDFKIEVNKHMIQLEYLNRQAENLRKGTSADQAFLIGELLADIYKRWKNLLKNIAERQEEIEMILMRQGHFQSALGELQLWVSQTEAALDDLKPVFGDTEVLEGMLAKLQVLTNDMVTYENRRFPINTAGHKLMVSNCGSEVENFMKRELHYLNIHWQTLQNKIFNRYKEVEGSLKDVHETHQVIQNMLMWLNAIDKDLAFCRPVGGLPKTAKEQLRRFLNIYFEMDLNNSTVKDVIKRGNSYLKKSDESSTKSLEKNVNILQQRWKDMLTKANGRKLKLEIAFREVMEFDDELQSFIKWLSNAEKYILTLKPINRNMNSVLEQVAEHKKFQEDNRAHSDVLINLRKKFKAHLKCFSQKKDVFILEKIFNNIQQRWERLISKSSERTTALEQGYKESREILEKSENVSAPLRQSPSSDENSFTTNQPSTSETNNFRDISEIFRNMLSSQINPRNVSYELLSSRPTRPSSRHSQDAVDGLRKKGRLIVAKRAVKLPCIPEHTTK